MPPYKIFNVTIWIFIPQIIFFCHHRIFIPLIFFLPLIKFKKLPIIKSILEYKKLKYVIITLFHGAIKLQLDGEWA